MTYRLDRRAPYPTCWASEFFDSAADLLGARDKHKARGVRMFEMYRITNVNGRKGAEKINLAQVRRDATTATPTVAHYADCDCRACVGD